MNINKLLTLIILVFSLSACSALSAISAITSIIPSKSSSNSGTSVKANANFQNGNNKLNGGNAEIRNNLGKVAGNNQNNLNANKIIVNKSSFWQIIGALLVGLTIAFWFMPHPKIIYKKIKDKMTKRK